MLLKLGVDISRLNRQIRRALKIVDGVYREVTGEEAVVTSTFEGNHSQGSLHYSNDAIDTRLPEKSPLTLEIIRKLKARLGDNYDIVPSNFCIHIEYDPK